eukprot:scaffold9955_cov20-Tisochrysis_lutea.AAC.4
MHNGDYVANPSFPFFPSGTPRALVDLTMRSGLAEVMWKGSPGATGSSPAWACSLHGWANKLQDPTAGLLLGSQKVQRLKEGKLRAQPAVEVRRQVRPEQDSSRQARRQVMEALASLREIQRKQLRRRKGNGYCLCKR